MWDRGKRGWGFFFLGFGTPFKRARGQGGRPAEGGRPAAAITVTPDLLLRHFPEQRQAFRTPGAKPVGARSLVRGPLCLPHGEGTHWHAGFDSPVHAQSCCCDGGSTPLP